jgi:hypothetical protein
MYEGGLPYLPWPPCIIAPLALIACRLRGFVDRQHLGECEQGATLGPVSRQAPLKRWCGPLDYVLCTLSGARKSQDVRPCEGQPGFLHPPTIAGNAPII